MSSYGTEFTHDDGVDEMYVNRCCNENYPLMVFMAAGRVGVEMYRDDVKRFAEYLACIVDTVPERPEPEPEPAFEYESVGAISDGQIIWLGPVRQVCHNTLNIAGKKY